MNIQKIPKFTYEIAEYTYNLTGVIGRGAFCTAFLATEVESSATETQVIIKREGLISCKKHTPPLVQLQAECEILRRFTQEAVTCHSLPKLQHDSWQVTTAASFIPLLPVGVPLERRCAELGSAQRSAAATACYRDISAGLVAAHELHLCHRDVRPANVVYNPGRKCFVLIDWGLAAAPGTPMHPHEGGLPFFHDEIVTSNFSGNFYSFHT